MLFENVLDLLKVVFNLQGFSQVLLFWVWIADDHFFHTFKPLLRSKVVSTHSIALITSSNLPWEYSEHVGTRNLYHDIFFTFSLSIKQFIDDILSIVAAFLSWSPGSLFYLWLFNYTLHLPAMDSFCPFSLDLLLLFHISMIHDFFLRWSHFRGDLTMEVSQSVVDWSVDLVFGSHLSHKVILACRNTSGVQHNEVISVSLHFHAGKLHYPALVAAIPVYLDNKDSLVGLKHPSFSIMSFLS